MQPKAKAILAEIKKIVIGKDEVLQKILVAILAKGHILLEDIPGVGKTTIATTFSRVLGLDYRRLQFTIDVLPSDIVGFTSLNQTNGEVQLHKGIVFTNLFLADEINRTSPKTQAALLEVMEEKQITVDGLTQKAPDPFIVIATQNPIGSIGTNLLPDSQLDRFAIKLHIGYPKKADEIIILKQEQKQTIFNQLAVIATQAEVLAMQAAVAEVFVEDSLYDYIVRLLEATRTDARILEGASTRAGISLLQMVKAQAFVSGRDYITPADINYLFADVIAHRIQLKHERISESDTPHQICTAIINHIQQPKIR